MITQFRRRFAASGRSAPAVVAALVAGFLGASCDKVPLTAPTGSIITLFTSSNVLSPDGSLEITATVIQQGAAASTSTGTNGSTTSTATAGAGQPVHNGTLVTFTTTLGTIEPKEAQTRNGQVTVQLKGDGRSGVAKIIAFSGGAQSAELTVKVGDAAVETVVVTASPQSLPPTGGTCQVTAFVQDADGNSVSGIDVTFSSDAGSFTPSTAQTGADGRAQATLTTARETTVRATAGGKTSSDLKITLAPRTGISITPPASSPTTGQAASFTVTVASGVNVQDVTVSWGDGRSASLGAISASTVVTHVYTVAATYTVTATATDASGSRESVSTTVTVLPAAPVTVTLQASSTQPVTGQNVTFVATTGTLPAGTVIVRYDWNFGDGTPTTSTTSGTATHIFNTAGPKDIVVSVVLSNGSTGVGVTSINVTQPAAPTLTVSAVPGTIAAGGTVIFTAQLTSALPPGRVVDHYEWDFGDGQTAQSTGNQIPHTYAASTTPGTKTVTVRVVLDDATTGSGFTTVNVT
jgi:hypothetical protein